jgi:hypothetical protein
MTKLLKLRAPSGIIPSKKMHSWSTIGYSFFVHSMRHKGATINWGRKPQPSSAKW